MSLPGSPIGKRPQIQSRLSTTMLDFVQHHPQLFYSSSPEQALSYATGALSPKMKPSEMVTPGITQAAQGHAITRSPSTPASLGGGHATILHPVPRHGSVQTTRIGRIFHPSSSLSTLSPNLCSPLQLSAQYHRTQGSSYLPPGSEDSPLVPTHAFDPSYSMASGTQPSTCVQPGRYVQPAYILPPPHGHPEPYWNNSYQTHIAHFQAHQYDWAGPPQPIPLSPSLKAMSDAGSPGHIEEQGHPDDNEVAPKEERVSPEPSEDDDAPSPESEEGSNWSPIAAGHGSRDVRRGMSLRPTTVLARDIKSRKAKAPASRKRASSIIVKAESVFNPKGKKSNRKLKHADVEKARRSKITVGTDDLWMIIEAEWRDKFSEVYHKRINDRYHRGPTKSEQLSAGYNFIAHLLEENGRLKRVLSNARLPIPPARPVVFNDIYLLDEDSRLA